MKKLILTLIIVMMLAGCRQVDDGKSSTGSNGQITGKTDVESSREQSINNKKIYTTKFSADGKKYIISAVNTMETHVIENPCGEKVEKYIYYVYLENENGVVLQQFLHNGSDETAEVFCDDLNFDGYPDFEIISSHYESGSAGTLYLWDVQAGQLMQEGISLPRTYVVHEAEKIFSLVGSGEDGDSEILCRLNEKNEIEELRSYTLNRKESYVQIWDAKKKCFLIKENVILDEEDNPERAADYQAILWSDLPES